MTAQRLIPFDQLTVDDVATAGGKGANLGELTRAGLPVPPGFVVTAEAYLEAMDDGGVRERAPSRCEPRSTPTTPPRCRHGRRPTRARAQGRGSRPRSRREILDAYQRLGSRRVSRCARRRPPRTPRTRRSPA